MFLGMAVVWMESHQLKELEGLDVLSIRLLKYGTNFFFLHFNTSTSSQWLYCANKYLFYNTNDPLKACFYVGMQRLCQV